MPVALTNPIVETVTTIDSLHVQWDVEAGNVMLLGAGAIGGIVHHYRVTMSAAAFVTALQAQTGAIKARIYKVFLSQIGNDGAVT